MHSVQTNWHVKVRWYQTCLETIQDQHPPLLATRLRILPRKPASANALQRPSRWQSFSTGTPPAAPSCICKAQGTPKKLRTQLIFIPVGSEQTLNLLTTPKCYFGTNWSDCILCQSAFTIVLKLWNFRDLSKYTTKHIKTSSHIS